VRFGVTYGPIRCGVATISTVATVWYYNTQERWKNDVILTLYLWNENSDCIRTLSSTNFVHFSRFKVVIAIVPEVESTVLSILRIF
jgi:hypothetical protein